jgi:hypothetical protein
MFKPSFNKSGIVLSEALLAVAMLAISVLIMGSVITTAISTTALSKNYMIAQNFVTEGIEGVKKIRDTNWLLAPNDASCWLRVDTRSVPYPNKATSETSYVILVPADLNGKYALQAKGGVLDLTNGLDPDFKLNLDKLKPDFYRSIVFKDFNPEPNQGNRYVTLIVKVEWMEGGKVRTLERSMVIYNNI